MMGTHVTKAVKKAEIVLVFLICAALAAGGCSVPKPPPSQEARAFQEEVRAEFKALTDTLTEARSAGRDWEALKPILQASYQEMKEQGKLMPQFIVVLDRQGITRVRVPSGLKRQFDFSRYKPTQTVFKKKRRAQAVLYFKGTKLFIILAPLLHKNKVLGAVGLCFSEADVQKNWNISEEEFLNLDFNQ